MTGKVSAIISAYFCEDYLKGRIENLIAQTEVPEIVTVCKAGSKEHEIAREFDHVKIVTTEDVPTIYAAWNIGIKESTGDYITNANADDRLATNAIRTMREILDKETTYGVVYSDVEVVDEIGENPVSRYEWIEGGLPELLRGCFIGPMPMWRRKLHERLGYFNESYHVAGDYEMWLRFAKNGVKFYHYRGGALGCYLKRENSAEHREPLRSLWEANRARMNYR